jgi:hypothetical protein
MFPWFSSRNAYGKINGKLPNFKEGRVEYPLSRDEHAAMTRYLSGIRKQLQDVSDLFTSRYGKSSGIAEIAVKTLVSATLLEHEFMLLESEADAGSYATATNNVSIMNERG